MGAINVNRLRDSFPGTDAGNPRDQRAWFNIVRTMVEQGDPVPGIDLRDFPLADLTVIVNPVKNHLAANIGARIKREIDADPKNRNYAGAANDDDVATLMNEQFTTVTGFQDHTVLLQRTALAGNTIDIQAENGETQSLSTLAPLLPDVFIEFYALTPTVALRGTRVRVTSLTDVTIDLQSVPGAMTDADLFRVVSVKKLTEFPRRALVLRAAPYAPRSITGQDITDAKV